jgi:hypothetical protein
MIKETASDRRSVVYLKKKLPAYRTDAVLRKYRDVSARCTSFGPYFNKGNQNPFYFELTKTDEYYRECLGNQASFTVGIYRGEDATCHSMQIPNGQPRPRPSSPIYIFNIPRFFA